MEYSALLKKFASSVSTDEEKHAFNVWLDSLSLEEYEKVLDEYELILLNEPVSDEFRKEWLDDLLVRIRTIEDQQNKVRSIPVRRKEWWLVAASVIFFIAAGSYLVIFNKKAEQPKLVNITVPSDIKAPQTNRAVIILANGKQIFLDSAGNGILAAENNVRIVKQADGKIEYSSSDRLQPETVNASLIYNTLTNPRGSKVIDIALSDGSRVWLNAGSSLTYPVVFVGKERKVSVTGEAYFEVSHNAIKPFYVTKGGMEVKVLGTRFNINAYDDEREIKVTLLNGSVKVSDYENTVVIRPGEQVRIADNQKLSTTSDIDLDEVMAWKNGKFIFTEKTDIQTIMRQISRWYNVEVEYRGIVNRHFWGSISNSVNVSQILKMLETTGGVTISIENGKVIVMPGK